MDRPRILAFSGSTRRESFNGRLIRFAASRFEAAGADVTRLDLGDYPLPIFNQDDEAEQGSPAGLAALKDLFEAHDGIAIACPEYNSSITPLLKNTLDWLSRKHGDEASMRAYRGKTAALFSASGGRLGGMRGLVHVRAILNNLGVLVLPDQLAVAAAHQAFDDRGELVDESQRNSVDRIAEKFIDTLQRLA